MTPEIIILDDNTQMLQSYLTSIKETLAIQSKCASTIEEAEIMTENFSGIILIDYQVCITCGIEFIRKLKENSPNCFIICLVNKEEENLRIEALNNGAHICLLKPIEMDELLAQLVSINELWQIRENLIQSELFARNTAFSAMQSASDLGMLLNFCKNSYKVDNVKDVIKILEDNLKEISIEGNIIVFFDNDIYSNHSLDSNLTKAHISLCKNSSKGKKIKEFGKISSFSWENISLLCKNMTIDSTKRGQLRDYFAFLVEVAQMQIESLLLSKNSLTASIGIKSIVHEIIQEQMKTKLVLEDTANNLIRHIEKSFYQLGLSEKQESTLVNLLEEYAFSMVEVLSQEVKVKNKLIHIAERLST